MKAGKARTEKRCIMVEAEGDRKEDYRENLELRQKRKEK
jgi:hypothetical protein